MRTGESSGSAARVRTRSRTTPTPLPSQPLVHFSPPDAATFAAFLRTRVYRPQSLVWLEGYEALLRCRWENEITGLYAVPYDTEFQVGVTKDFPSGGGCTSSARLRADELDPHRKELLDASAAGMVWEPGCGAGRGRGDGARRADMANFRRRGAKNGLHSPACRWTATISASDFRSRSSRAPGRGSCLSSRSGCPR